MPKAPKAHARKKSAAPKHERPEAEVRGTSHERGYDGNWSKFRNAKLKQKPLCEYCEAKGITVAAKVLDHDLPHRGDPELFWNNTYTSLCSPCHSGPKQSAERRYGGKALLEWVERQKTPAQ